jgi:hypothetical protein
MKKAVFISISFLFLLFFWGCSGEPKEKTDIPAFPGALGAGKYTTGGRGGEVVLVTNLNDDGDGSFRKAVRKHGPRIVVFKVSGNINLKSSLDINNGDITIAGQTAPGDGICLTGYTLKVKADNVIIRYLRARPGDISGEEMDAFTCKDNRNVIIDHCSFSWGSDEVCSVYDNDSATVQWCIVSESMNNSVHHKGKHGYGGIWGGRTVSFIGNLLVHHISRNPRLQGSRYHKKPEKERAEIVNNVVYNWKYKCIYAGEAGNYNIINNYFKPGPATIHSASKQFMEPYKPYSNYYISGNILEGNDEVTMTNANGVELKDISPDSIMIQKALTISDYQPLEAAQAYDAVLNNAGASLHRDSVDIRIVQEVRDGSFTFGENGIIDSQNDVGGWIELKCANPAADIDSDGIPDDWEDANGLDKSDPDDASAFSLSEEYTNIEMWMNGLVE